MKRIPIRITPDGKVFGIFPDSMDLKSIGRVKIDRLSHVEFDNIQQAWFVESCLSGKRIGGLFRTRKDALKFEVQYMEKRLGEIRDIFVA